MFMVLVGHWAYPSDKAGYYCSKTYAQRRDDPSAPRNLVGFTLFLFLQG